MKKTVKNRLHALDDEIDVIKAKAIKAAKDYEMHKKGLEDAEALIASVAKEQSDLEDEQDALLALLAVYDAE